MAEFRMPSLGADMEAATLVKWHVQAGDSVQRNQVIAEVDTDKGIIEIECFESGVVERLIAEPGTKLPVGAPMAMIRGKGSAPSTPPSPESTVAPEPAMAAEPTGSRPTTGAVAPTGPRLRSSPLARKVATELGIDLGQVEGTGPGGVIERADVERAAAQAKVSPPPAEPSPPPSMAESSKGEAGMRRAIAAAMARSNRDIPHYYLQTRIDMTRAMDWLTTENARRPIAERLLPVVLQIKAVAKALRDVPELNGFWTDDQHRIADAIHIGFAVALKHGGLVTPAIHHTDRLNLDDLMTALRDLIPRARAGRMRSSEMTDPTITLTCLGDLGVETVYGVIYPPQVALVGFGKILDQPWAENSMLAVRPVLNATLAADHRATDGHRGAQFLEALNHHFQNPEEL